MKKWLKFYATYTFSTSPHSRYRTTLLNTKVLNFIVSQENCETILSELCNNFWQLHDKIAETLCLVLEVCPAPRTQALDDAQLAAIAASRIDWSRRPNSSIRRISSSLTLAILDW